MLRLDSDAMMDVAPNPTEGTSMDQAAAQHAATAPLEHDPTLTDEDWAGIFAEVDADLDEAHSILFDDVQDDYIRRNGMLVPSEHEHMQDWASQELQRTEDVGA